MEEIEDRSVRHQAVVVEAHARPGPGLLVAAVAAIPADEVRVARPAEAVEIGKDVSLSVDLEALVSAGRPVEAAGAEPAAGDASRTASSIWIIPFSVSM